eukprot:GFUD01023467.1.p1 GENE.GFUD01023467.1~~GFUD01023467.1.p1  ORF type:complete len:399 (-),score=161.26 GFUD01023467.1:242-1438(-)
MPIAASASRFACLPDDDSSDWKAPKTKSKGKKEESKKVVDNKPKDASKAKALKEAKELQNMAFGGDKKKSKKKKGSQQQPQPQPQPPPSQPEASPAPSASSPSPSVTPASLPPLSSTQYEEWKEKDKVLVEDNFTAAMQEAILQSKLEFEQQKALLEAQERLMANGIVPDSVLASLSKEERKRVVKQQKKPATMSLDQFNTEPAPEQIVADLTAPTEPQVYKHPRHKDRVGAVRTSPAKELREGADFFNQMDEAAVKALNREQLLESYRSQEATNGSESALVANYREKLVEKDQQLQETKAEVKSLNNKLTEVKLRSKKLTEILMSGEMREKTEVLVQVHKLEKVRDELSSSLSFTSGQLEQERSLVHQLEIEIKKGAAGGGEQDVCNRLMGMLRNRK